MSGSIADGFDDRNSEGVCLREHIAPEAVAHRPQQTIDELGRVADLQLRLDERDDLELDLTNPIAGARDGRSDRLTDDHERLDRDPGAGAQVGEGGLAKGGEVIERRVLEEVE